MAVVVQKYGGSSVADIPRLQRVAERVAATVRDGHRVVVVVSAMGNTTNELLTLARRVSPHPGRRELDMLVSVGERITMALLSMAVADLGVPAVSFTGSQSGIITDDHHASARILEVRPDRIRAALEEGRVAIVAGFQGVSRSREVTTLGRGGSDTTAVALAAALPADLCEICSDVDGIFSADPRVVPEARHLDRLSWDQALALFRGGARVLHPEAVAFAARHGITLHAVATEASTGGTEVGPPRGGETAGQVLAVTVDGQVDRVTPGVGGLPALLDALVRTQAPVRAVRSDGVLVDRRDFPQRDRVAWPEGVRLEPVCVATAVGPGCGRPERLAEGARALEAAGLSVTGLEADGDRLAWTLPEGSAPVAERALHAALVGRAP